MTNVDLPKLSFNYPFEVYYTIDEFSRKIELTKCNHPQNVC